MIWITNYTVFLHTSAGAPTDPTRQVKFGLIKHRGITSTKHSQDNVQTVHHLYDIN